MSNPGVTNAQWQGLYRLGGLAARVIAVRLLGEIVFCVYHSETRDPARRLRPVWSDWLTGLLTLDLRE